MILSHFLAHILHPLTIVRFAIFHDVFLQHRGRTALFSVGYATDFVDVMCHQSAGCTFVSDKTYNVMISRADKLFEMV